MKHPTFERTIVFAAVALLFVSTAAATSEKWHRQKEAPPGMRAQGVPETIEFYGFIRGVFSDGRLVTVNIDEVMFLSGEEAIAMAAEDTECEHGNASDCVPSLNNDFYIRNIDPAVSAYPVSGGAVIVTQKSSGSPESRQVSLAQFQADHANPELLLDRLPFKFKAVGGTIIEMSQQYVP